MRTLPDAERAILCELSGSIPEGPRPYAVIAERAGLDERSALGIIRGLMARGAIRRVAAILHDRKLGYNGNAMVVWRVPCEDSPEALEKAGAAAAARPEISHVYARRTSPNWPYNLYTMVHARSRDEVAALVEELRPLIGASDHRVLFTLREFTKRAPCYPCLTGAGRTAAHGGREVLASRRQEE